MSFLSRLFVQSHIAIYRLTGGALGANSGTSRTLLLTTTGRKSGQPRTTPLRYIPHGSDYLIAASNWGKSSPPAWFLNLQANPTLTIQVMNQHLTAQAQIAPDDQQDDFYQQFIAADARFIGYKQSAGRPIPIVILHPISSS